MTVSKLLRTSFGDDILANYSWKFGLGVDPQSDTKPSTGIELPENFGQVSNVWSVKDRFSNSILWTIEEELKSGYGKTYGIRFPSLDLYDDKYDSDEVAEIKNEIKGKIKDALKTGSISREEIKTLLKKLISIDPKYKGVNFSDGALGAIFNEIEQISAYDGHTQVITPGNMYNASIGQGISAFTPLQLANYIATIVNGGTRYKVHIVDKITDADGKVIEQTEPEILEKTGIKQSTINAVKLGMKSVTETGTARGTFDGFPIETAGKTGSATAREDQEELGRTSYAVYVGFAPYDKPQIAVAVLIFDGGHGGFIAPVARAIYEAYFKAELDAKGYTPVNDIVAKPLK
jgi:penicillin-binding protein 2